MSKKSKVKTARACQMPSCNRKATKTFSVFGGKLSARYRQIGKRLCDVCFRWATMNPDMARSLGLLAPKGQWMVSVKDPNAELVP